MSLHTFAVLAYKESPYIRDCIISLKNQSLKSDIIIFTSTPSIFLNDISREFHIPIDVNDKSEGIASDWSFAYNRSKSKYVTLAHQDDIYLPGYTEFCLRVLEKKMNSRNLLIFTDYKELVENKRIVFNTNFLIKRIFLLPYLFQQNIKSSFLRRAFLSLGTPICCPSVMYHKEHIGDFEFSKDFTCNMDWDAWLRLADREGSFIYIRKRLMVHRIHKQSQTSFQIANMTRKKEEKLIFKRLWPQPVDRIIANIYHLGLKSNIVRDDS